ncbi:nucleotide sugar dehydrogenase [Haloarcula marina]|uniref:nucleotide sugar dehydrogenase n=1 Tax=Haloarcula marina TaxID=2961574 RepID=UPI0020B8B6FE|nr:nucleotide sugar dehydrogenase [Halomicroarcula marina]
MRRLAVFGLGYVGSEVAMLASERGFEVTGVDTDSTVVQAAQDAPLTTSERFTATTDGAAAVTGADTVVVTVPTPIDSSFSVDLSALQAVCETVATGLPESPGGTLVVVESTIPPGTVSDIVAPAFEDLGHVPGQDVQLAHAPERIDPGNDEWSLAEIPRVVGADNDSGLDAAVTFYERLLDASIHPVSSTAAAAASKIIENAYRDINIAFVNEIATTLEQLGIDTTEVLDAADTKPFGFTRFSPGAGVGGHCIPIDPYFLIEKATSKDLNSRFLETAREINDKMPRYVADKTIHYLVRSGRLPQHASVLLLGKAFKPDIPDTRNSPYFPIRTALETYDVSIHTYDPLLPSESTVESPYQPVDAVVLVTDHEAFRGLDPERLADRGVEVVVDGRNVLDADAIRAAGLRYAGVGRP